MNLKHISIVFKKELMDMFRDKKTIISSVLIPIILFPIMYGFMGFSQRKMATDVEKNGIKIAIISEEKDASIVKFLEGVDKLKKVDVENADEAVKKGTVSAVIIVDKGFDQAISEGTPAPVTIQYDDTNQTSLMSAEMIKGIISQYTSSVVSQRLQAKGIDPQIINPVAIKDKTTTPEEEGSGIGMLIFSMLLPMFLSIYAATSVLPAATDNGAGEKERGTLEPLLTTQANRMSLLAGKYFAITIAGIVGTAASMVGLFIAQSFNPELLGKGKALPPSSILIVALAAVCLTLIFAALELAISVYARSFKEAQTYLSPLTIVAMLPAFAVYMMDPKNISMVYFNIPIVNIICIIKEMIVGVYNPVHIALAFGWGLVYIIAAALFARHMFRKESVVFRV
jgi:sodium transport system permease protein